jgi:hypothetical protein
MLVNEHEKNGPRPGEGDPGVAPPPNKPLTD